MSPMAHLSLPSARRAATGRHGHIPWRNGGSTSRQTRPQTTLDESGESANGARGRTKTINEMFLDSSRHRQTPRILAKPPSYARSAWTVYDAAKLVGGEATPCAAWNTASQNERQQPTRAGLRAGTQTPQARGAGRFTANCAAPPATTFLQGRNGTPWDAGRWCVKTCCDRTTCHDLVTPTCGGGAATNPQGQAQPATRPRLMARGAARPALVTCRHTRSGWHGHW